MALEPDNSPRTDKQVSELRTLDPNAIEFHPTLRVVNRTRRFSLPIPNLGDEGEPLIFPPSSERAGEAIKVRDDGTPERGVVFYNQTDGIWQGVRANGEEVLVFNDVDFDTALSLMKKIQAIKTNVDELTLDEIKGVIRYAQLELGIADIYNGKRSSIENGTLPHEDMPVPLRLDGTPRNDFGYRLVNKEVVHRVALISSGFIFGDKRAQRYSDGAIVMTDEKHRWCVDKGVFQRNFKKVLEDGREAALGPLEAEFA